MPRQYRFGKKPRREKTYEEMLLDLKEAIERESKIHRKRKKDKKSDEA